jgi:hypothetical protein
MSTINEDLLNENILLRGEISELKKQNSELKHTIQNMQDNVSYEICEYFNNCNSLQKTADQFYFDNVRDCYEALVEYNGCSDSVQSADDYKKYHLEIFGYEYDEDLDLEEDDEISK